VTVTISTLLLWCCPLPATWDGRCGDLSLVNYLCPKPHSTSMFHQMPNATIVECMQECALG
jgi:hypothetical protein